MIRHSLGRSELGGVFRHPALRIAPLAALLLWAPVPFGSVTGPAAAAVAVASFAVAAVALVLERERALAAATRFAVAALVALAGLGALQLAPLPAGLAGFLSPEHARLARSASEALGDDAPSAVGLTVDRDATADALVQFASAAAALLAAALVGGSRRARRGLLAALVAAGLFQVIYGAQQWATGASTIWGVVVPYSNRLRGSFVNPNHLALLLAIAFVAAFAWLWWALRRQLAETRASAEQRIASVAPAAAVTLLLFVGLAFTGSRGGLLGALAAVAAQITLSSLGGRRWAAIAGGSALALAVATVALWGPQAGFGRLGRLFVDGSSPLRVEGAAAAMALWAKFPLFGCGLGGYRAAFPLVARRDPEGTLWHAHSDWLELGATGGLAAVALVALALAAVALRLLRLWREGERSEDRAAALAALGALTAAALHELVDFGLTIPANGLVLAVVVGAALGVPLRAEASRVTEDV